MRIKILNLYVFKKLLFSFLGAEVIYSLIFFIQNLFLLSGLIIEKNAPAKESITLALCLLPKTIMNTLPFSIIFAALFVAFHLSSTSELIAINSAGINLKQQQKPFFVFAILASVLYFYLSFVLVPYSKQKRDNTINQINLKSIIYSLTPGKFNKISDQLYLYANVSQKNLFENVIAFNYLDFNDFEIIYSKKAKLELDREKLFLTLGFYNGKGYSFTSRKKAPQISESSFSKKVLIAKINPDYLTKKDSIKGKIDKFNLIKFVNLLKNKDKIAFSILLKRLSMLFFVFLSPFLGFYLGFSLKRGAVVSGAVLYGFTITFVYIFLLNLFTNLYLHNSSIGLIGIFILNGIFLYFTLLNKKKIEKPLTVKSRGSFLAVAESKINIVQDFFEKNFIKKADDQEIVSFRFPLLIRYIIVNFLKVFFLFFVMLQGIFILTITLKILVNLLKYKSKISDGLLYVIYSTLSSYPLIVPFSLLLAVLFFFIMLEDKNEITAIKSLGINLFSIITPIVYLSLLLSIILLSFTTTLSPIFTKKSNYLFLKINSKKKMVYQEKIKLKNHAVLRSFKNKNGFYWCEFYDFDGGNFLKFLSVELDFNIGNLKKLYRAEKLLFKGEKVLKQVNSILFVRKDNAYQFITNPDTPLIWDNLRFFKELEPSPQEMTQTELRRFISRKKSLGIKPYKYITSYYYRFSSAFAPLVLLFFGLPFALLGEGRKKKPVAGIGFGLMIIVLYYLLTSLFLSLGAKHLFPSFLAAWFSNIIFLLIGLYMLTKIKT